MIKLETLTEFQTETLGGGWGGWRVPSVTSQGSTIEFTNGSSQTNIGSAWATSTSATGGGGGYPFISIPVGGESKAYAKLEQSNTNGLDFTPLFTF